MNHKNWYHFSYRQNYFLGIGIHSLQEIRKNIPAWIVVVALCAPPQPFKLIYSENLFFNFELGFHNTEKCNITDGQLIGGIYDKDFDLAIVLA